MPTEKETEKRRRWTIWLTRKDHEAIERIRAHHGLSNGAEAVRLAIHRTEASIRRSGKTG